MGKIIVEDLKERQSWSLNQKIDHSIGIIEQFYNYNKGKIYVSFSGGKDSVVLLHLVRRMYPEVKAVFYDTTNEYAEIYKFVKKFDNLEIFRPKYTFLEVLKKYGFPLVSKEQAQYIHEYRITNSEKMKELRWNGRIIKGKYRQGKIADKWKFLTKVDFEVTHRCCYYLKKEPAHRFEKKSGLKPVVGTMAHESQLRKQKYLKTGCNSFGNKIESMPLSIWTEKDIWDYIKRYNVEYCSIYDDKEINGKIIPGEKTTGCVMCGFGAHLENKENNRFYRLYKRYPKRYKSLMDKTGFRIPLKTIGIKLPDENKI